MKFPGAQCVGGVGLAASQLAQRAQQTSVLSSPSFLSRTRSISPEEEHPPGIFAQGFQLLAAATWPGDPVGLTFYQLQHYPSRILDEPLTKSRTIHRTIIEENNNRGSTFVECWLNTSSSSKRLLQLAWLKVLR